MRPTRASLRSIAALAVAAIGLAVGCSDAVASGAGVGGDGAPVVLADYCGVRAIVECGALVPCCLQRGYAATTAACENARLDVCRAEVVAEIAQSRAYDPVAAGSCLANVRGAVDRCASGLVETPGATGNYDCEHIWIGTAPVGGACTTFADCAPAPAGATVDCVAVGASARCATTAVAGLGEVCGVVDATTLVSVRCDTGLACDFVLLPNGTPSSELRCAVAKEIGAACTSSRACRYGLTCAPASHTCVFAGDVGAACDPADTSSCLAPRFCDVATHACAFSPSAGAACDLGHSPSCAQDATCDATSGRCVAKRPAGQPCAAATDCATGHCDASPTSTARSCVPDPGVATWDACAPTSGGTAGP